MAYTGSIAGARFIAPSVPRSKARGAGSNRLDNRIDLDNELTRSLSGIIFRVMKTATKVKEKPALACPVCMSDRLETISTRMAKCESCGFIWNHEVSDRDNLLLILEHQAKVERAKLADPQVPLQIFPKKTRSVSKVRK
jgi:hypothetical protein